MNGLMFSWGNLVKTCIACFFVALFIPLACAADDKDRGDETASIAPGQLKDVHVGGYMITSLERVDESYGAGYSMYSAVWPLVRQYPGRNFQSGLFGTWMFPENDEPLPIERFYTCIEGGLGWWRDTEYATETPKFIMGGVQLNFAGWANGPGAGRGRDWDDPRGKYGVAQLSPWVLWPPDGLNLQQGTSGELFGSGYLPLPLTEPKATTAGADVPTGNQCWTLFLNTSNFKGPVAFFTPFHWTEASVEDPRLAGLFLDQRPSRANKAFQMETQHIRSYESMDAEGNRYVRAAQIQYPVGPDGDSELLHRLMVYDKSALWDAVEAWFQGGEPADSKIDLAGATMQDFKKDLHSTWSIFGAHIPSEERARMNISSFIDVNEIDQATLRIRWKGDLIHERETDNGKLLTLPEYYKLVKEDGNDVGQWVAVPSDKVPEETGLHEADFDTPSDRTFTTYVTPDDQESSWKSPGPVAGPFQAKLGDGSTVTYYWYRFADQPTLLNAGMSREEREEMQRRVELLHQHWTKDREYLPPPKIGSLAGIDPALIVTPPEGLEIGYVPIATRQGF